MKHTLLLGVLLVCQMAFVSSSAFAANPQDEQTVRNAYAKLAYAVQSRTVYVEVQKNQNLKSSELTQKLQDNELRFDITDMTSGTLSDIGSRPYSDFVTKPDGQDVLGVTHETATFNEKGQRYTSLFAVPKWNKDEPIQERPTGAWDTPVKDVMAITGGNKYNRYVTATITVWFQGRSRTYRTLWLFGSNNVSFEPMVVDLVTGDIVRDFATESAYPSVLTDTSLRSRTVINDWLNSTQRVDASCKTGKQDVCCDSALRCGVHSEDLRSTKPAPNTKAIAKGGL
jgi:hypothetical protein